MPISLDPEEYPDPKRFFPERFLNEDLEKPLAGHWSFGMGRRGRIRLELPSLLTFLILSFFPLLFFSLCSPVFYTNSSLRRLRPRNAKSLDSNLPHPLLFQRLLRRGPSLSPWDAYF